MKLQILSDLHTEFAEFELPETDADVVILAGDIGVGAGGLEWVSKQQRNKPFIYVPGNHEFYGQDIALIDDLRSGSPPNVHLLDNQHVLIDSIRVICNPRGYPGEPGSRPLQPDTVRRRLRRDPTTADRARGRRH